MALLLSIFAATLAHAAKPNIALIVLDDLGWADVDVSLPATSNVHTPNLHALFQEGQRLTRHYGQPVCSPSRAALHTGRVPLAYGLQTYVIDPEGVNYGLNLNETTLPQLLKARGGYSCHARGKWHMGMAQWNQTPTFRGYDSFQGFYSGGQDYFTHSEAGGYDFHYDPTPNCGAGCSQMDWDKQGIYSTHVFTSGAVDVITNHDPATSPLFLYLAYQAVHAPDQVPPQYEAPYNATIPASDPRRRTFAGMLSALDEGIGNVTAALKAKGMYDNTIIVIVADNGGPVACSAGICGDHTGTSNYPLRGGKHSLWEGGTRLFALLRTPHSTMPVGTNHTGLMHHVDWLPTLLDAAGVGGYTPAPGFELHGVSQWAALTTGCPSPRNETLLNIDPYQPLAPPYQGNAAIVTAEGWKLIVGEVGPPWGWSPPNSSLPGAPGELPATLPPLNCSLPEKGVCYPGGDITNTPLPSAPDCCTLCSTTQGCKGYTYRGGSQGKCYLKATLATPTKDPQCISGEIGRAHV